MTPSSDSPSAPVLPPLPGSAPAPQPPPTPPPSRRPRVVAGLALGALGVVFGDIGTSPLYALQTVFSANHNAVTPSREDVFGVVSMVFWAITIVVSYGYAALMLRADNDGEGGILSLVALLRRTLRDRPRLVGVALVLGILGAGLFYGDSVITPAISVMSAVEGLSVVDERFHVWVLPLSVLVLGVLFGVQRFGSGRVGRFFGPVMAVWFTTLGAVGLPHVLREPEILGAISPHHAIQFALTQPGVAFIAAGAVVLTVTGVEALYADMGHFGPRPIRLAWFALVFPALALNYLGQGAEILRNPGTAANPFFLMAPEWARVPLVVLATLATVIASQAVIAGAFSVSRQAVRTGLLPSLRIVHTSKEEGGQIYIAAVNWILFTGVVVLIAVFRNPEGLASAYGLAVTGTLLLEMTIFLLLARYAWRVTAWKIAVALVLVLGVEAVFLSANVAKLLSGGWLPILIAGAVVVAMVTWRRGSAVVQQRRRDIEGPLEDFIAHVRRTRVPRVPGLAVFPHHNKVTTPLALRQTLDFYQVLPERIAIVTIVHENVPHIRHVDRAVVDDLGSVDDGIVHIAYRVGFNDSQHVPEALRWARGKGRERIDLDPDAARYFVSTIRLTNADVPTLPRWRRGIFLWLAHNAADRTAAFHLPIDRSVVVGGRLEV